MEDATPVRDAILAKIEDRLNVANGKRRVRRLFLAEVLGLVRDVIEGRAWSYLNGGSVANAYRQPASTTFALAARVDGSIFLGITEVDAKGPSVGRAFAPLQPWRMERTWPGPKPEGPAGNAAEIWALWSASAQVIRLDAPEVDALLETGTIQ